ncbi:hypothetical protein BDZ97DRAFT_1821709 [Flammula alnicola]|nr:hypothetical protein BDZ97DRAFT_1821709 [Flammula alnicola]
MSRSLFLLCSHWVICLVLRCWAGGRLRINFPRNRTSLDSVLIEAERCTNFQFSSQGSGNVLKQSRRTCVGELNSYIL